MHNFDGKLKAVTFSYDDCTKQDIRLVEMFNRYGVKATFNVNSELLNKKNELIRDGMKVRHDKLSPTEVPKIYKGHEVAVHTLTHAYLQNIEDEEEIVRQVEEDRKNLENLVSYDVCGMAYPVNGNQVEKVEEIIRRRTKIRYARTTISNYSFQPQENLLEFQPTIHHVEYDKLFELGEKFINLKPDSPQIFYIWGHSFEFDIHDDWNKMEEFLKIISQRPDIFYGTNREVLLSGK